MSQIHTYGKKIAAIELHNSSGPGYGCYPSIRQQRAFFLEVYQKYAI